MSQDLELERPDEQRIWKSVPCTLPESTVQAMVAEAEGDPELEVCGFITSGGTVLPIPNVALSAGDGFEMDKTKMVLALTSHEVTGVYHSHPSGRAWPSSCDSNNIGFLYAQGCPWEYYIVANGVVSRFEHCDRSAI